ncbi:MAG: hypothetical protein LBH11_07485, partial [Propionibacteriaceae bacterium]|nr:hypothetical protein [Propionibacteriaceae bacterium]
NLDDPDTAAKLFGKAFDILYAVDTALPYLTPMMGKYLSALFDSSQHGVATEFIADFDKRMADAMADSERKLTQSGHADDHSSQEWLAHQRLEAAYCEGGLLHSRMAAEAGDIAKAARIAEKSGERLAGFGNINLACDAFCTAGALFAKLGDDHASYCYESAMEAAGILNQRNRRVSIGDTLITLLKSQGREEEASELASRVAGLRP